MTVDPPEDEYPTRARELFDRLEAETEGDVASDPLGAGTGSDDGAGATDVHGDWVPEVPGSGEPPD